MILLCKTVRIIKMLKVVDEEYFFKKEDSV